MKPLILAGIGLTVLCWGMYGNVLHIGQDGFVNSDGSKMQGFRLKPLICVGFAYFIVAILLPGAFLASKGELQGWTGKGVTWSMLAGVAGALGAMGIILAMTSGGKPIYVMPLVFGGAPVINVTLAMILTKAYKQEISPMFYVGLVLVAAGATMVLIYQPKSKGKGKPHAKAPPAATATENPGDPQSS